MAKELTNKKDIKLFEVEIKATIIYPTFSFVELYDFACEVYELIRNLFKEANIRIKKDNKGLEELEILNVKEALGKEREIERLRG